MTYQKTTGSLMASGYQKLGTQEAANDMYIVGGGGDMHRKRTSIRSDCNGKRNMQDAELYALPNDNTSDCSETKNMNWDGTQISPTLTKNNANGGQRMPDKENFNCVIGKMNNARTQDEILRLLWETYGKEKVEEWATAIMVALQQAEVLRQGMHEESIQGEAETWNQLDGSTLPCPELVAGWMLRDMWEQQECGCTPYRWESAEQRFIQLTETMPELPYEGTPSIQDLFNMWREGKGLWTLQQTLYQIQKIRRSVDGKEGGDGMKDVSTVVRRLTPL